MHSYTARSLISAAIHYRIEVNNNVGLETLWSIFPPQYQDQATGRVIYGCRYRGTISNAMDLSMFPLDSDYFCIKVGPKSETTKTVQLKIDPKKHGKPEDNLPGDSIKESSLTEWTLDVPFARLGVSGPTGSGNYYSNAELCVDPTTPLLFSLFTAIAHYDLGIITHYCSCPPLFPTAA